MQCTADPCYGKLQHMGGENQEDFGCSNWFDRNSRAHDCLASKYIGFHTHVRVRKDWYYLAQYNLPFRWINSSNYRWYACRQISMNLDQLKTLSSDEIKVGTRVIFKNRFFDVYGHIGVIREVQGSKFWITWDNPRFNIIVRGKSPWDFPGYFALLSTEMLEQLDREKYADQYL